MKREFKICFGLLATTALVVLVTFGQSVSVNGTRVMRAARNETTATPGQVLAYGTNEVYFVTTGGVGGVGVTNLTATRVPVAGSSTTLVDSAMIIIGTNVTGGLVENIHKLNATNAVQVNGVDVALGTTTISAGTGLSGGGSLAANRTINMANTAVTPATYGDGTHVGQFTVDQQGRITGASAVAISASSLNVQESDGSPSVSGVTTIKVSNGTLTDNTGGVVTITTGGGGGSQTPWTSDINANGYNLTNAASISVGSANTNGSLTIYGSTADVGYTTTNSNNGNYRESLPASGLSGKVVYNYSGSNVTRVAFVASTDYADPATTISAGAGMSGGGSLAANRTLTWAPNTFVGNVTLWDGSQASRTITYDLSGTDPVWTISSGSVDLSTGTLKYGGNTVATSANNLSFFAATTSAQLKTLLSDETGSGGAAVFATAPTIDAPVFTTSAQLPNGASVTTGSVGMLGFDNDVYAASHGAFQYTDGTLTELLVGIDAASTFTDGNSVTWDNTNKKFKLTAVSGGSGLGYVLMGGTTVNNNPATSTTLYTGAWIGSGTDTFTNANVLVPKAMTIKALWVKVRVNGTTATSGNVVHKISVNGAAGSGTGVTLTYQNTWQQGNILSESIAVTAGQWIALECVYPASWGGTSPTNVTYEWEAYGE